MRFQENRMRSLPAALLAAAALATCLASPASAAPFETGWLADKKGAVDAKTGARIAMAVNMNGMAGPDGAMVWKMRHIGLELPLAELPGRRKILVFEENGRTIAHSDAEASENPFDQSGPLKLYLKLYLEHPPGFRFRVRIE